MKLELHKKLLGEMGNLNQEKLETLSVEFEIQNGWGSCTKCSCPQYQSRPQHDDICNRCGHNYYVHRQIN
jgi:hypothetical protein